MAIILEGKVRQGLQIASGLNPDPSLKLNNTIYLQKPFFKKAGVFGIDNIYNGTINFSIAPKEFKIIKPDYEVTCEWVKGVTETFWFVKAVTNFKGKEYHGYIYYPCPSSIKNHPDNIVEFLAEKIPNLEYGDLISIEVSEKQIKIKTQ